MRERQTTFCRRGPGGGSGGSKRKQTEANGRIRKNPEASGSIRKKQLNLGAAAESGMGASSNIVSAALAMPGKGRKLPESMHGTYDLRTVDFDCIPKPRPGQYAHHFLD